MGLKAKGAITWKRAISYAVSSTYIVEGNPNKNRAHCKICGITLTKGEGRGGNIREVIGSRSVSCYFCAPCAGRIMEHAEAWAESRNTVKEDNEAGTRS